MSAWELSGLTAVLAFLRRGAGGRGRASGGVTSCPASIPDPPGTALRCCSLLSHAWPPHCTSPSL